MDQNQGVTPGESPTPVEDVAAAPSTATQPVTADPGPVADRTWEQAFRELQRKDVERARTQDQILEYLRALQPPAVAQPAQPITKELTDEDLWSMAQQGDRNAFDVYMQRKAKRTYTEEQTVQNRAGIVDRQLTALFTRYPVLRDGSHALTQAVNGAIRLYVSQGYPDNAKGAPRQPNVEEVRLAKNMGVKDPEGAKKRFLERNAAGQSSISPTVAAALGDIPENF